MNYLNVGCQVHEEEKLGFLAEKFMKELTYETCRSYVTDIKQFFKVGDIRDIRIKDLQSVTVDMANEYLERLKETGLASATINNKMSAVFSLYVFLCRKSVGVCLYNPFSIEEGCQRIKSKFVRCVTKRSLSVEEVNTFINMVQIPDYQDGMEEKEKRKYLKALRDRVIVEILATTGCRRAEAIGIDLGDIFLSDGKWAVKIIGKGNRQRLLALPDAVKMHIDEYLKARGVWYDQKKMPLIVRHSPQYSDSERASVAIIYRVITKYADLSGLVKANEHISPHSFRHSYCSNTLDMGIDINLVSKCMGHAFVGTTERYDHSRRVVNQSPNEDLAALYGIPNVREDKDKKDWEDDNV